MEDENSSTTANSETGRLNYLQLLRQIDTLKDLSTQINKPSNILEDTSKIDELEIIFNNINETIGQISSQMDLEKHVMLTISIMSVIVRIAAIDTSNSVISREPFQTMYENLHFLIREYLKNDTLSAECVTNIFNSVLTNLAKDDFIDICLERISTGDKFSNITVKYDFYSIILSYIDYATDVTGQVIFQSGREFKNNYTSLLKSFQVFISNWLIKIDKNVPEIVIKAIQCILGFLWNLTDKIPLLPTFIEANYPEKSIEWIHTNGFTDHIKWFGESILNITYNLSRDKATLRQFRATKVFDILIEHKRLVEKQNNEDLKQIFGILLISFAIDDEQTEENKNTILGTTQTLYQDCENASKDANLESEEMHLSELLELLNRAFSNTYVIKHILDDNRIQYFVQLLLSFYGAALDPEPDYLEKRAVSALLKILLKISIYPEYLNGLVKNAQFCIIIKCLASRPKQNDAKRIWYNIEQIISPNSSEKMTSSMVYISYDQSDEDFCKEFVKELSRKISLPIWVEYENVESHEDACEYSYPIIKSATAAIVLMSTAYAKNTGKLQELSYILSASKGNGERTNLIVVNAESKFDFNKTRLKDFLHDTIPIPYDKEKSKMASKVGQQLVGSKKLRCKCLPFRRTRHQSETIKSISKPDFALPISKNNDSKDANSTKRSEPYSIVTSLSEQTGSIDNSTWV